MTDPRLAHDMAILDWARTILERHGHDIAAECNTTCLPAPEEHPTHPAFPAADLEDHPQEHQ